MTPFGQPGNPDPRLFRLPQARALINRMGFNNAGAAAMAGHLASLGARPGPLGINVGKNKDTPLERAVDDYLNGVSQLAPLADYVVVNASSPNTPASASSRSQSSCVRCSGGIQHRMEVAPGPAAPSEDRAGPRPEAIDAVVEVAVESRLAGLICTNTTITRPVSGEHAAEAGGLSGAPLAPLALATLRRASVRAQGRLALWASGGVFSVDDVLERLAAGADVVQIYTALVYEGRGWCELVAGLRARLAAQGRVRASPR